MTKLLAAVDIEISTPEGEELTARLDSDGHTFRLSSDALGRLVAGRSTADLNRTAGTVAEQGVVLELCDADGPVLRIGAVRAPWWQQLLTRSPRVRVVRWRAATRLKAAAFSSDDATTLMPPPVEWPMLPPLPWWNRRVTTTHDPYGGGHPRLYLADTRVPTTGREVRVLHLTPGETSIGSGADADVRIDGVDDLQVRISRTQDDEYVMQALSTTVPMLVHGGHVPEQTLRTGTRVELGPWRLTYVRDEYADHGRPFGGRIGGELGVQESQPEPRYQR